MSDVNSILSRAAELGLTLEVEGSRIAISPRRSCPADFLEEIRKHKLELMTLLSPNPPCPGWQAVPPNDLPLNPTTPRPTTARREAVISYLFRQAATCGPLARWLIQRENDYYDGPGRSWDCGTITYAAARDAAGWQLHRSEGVVWEFLEACAEVYDRRKPA
jgi:hypothetical protein